MVFDIKSCFPDADAALPVPWGTASVACAATCSSKDGSSENASSLLCGVLSTNTTVAFSSVLETTSKPLIARVDLSRQAYRGRHFVEQANVGDHRLGSV